LLWLHPFQENLSSNSGAGHRESSVSDKIKINTKKAVFAVGGFLHEN
jgi:hypothetical protein